MILISLKDVLTLIFTVSESNSEGKDDSYDILGKLELQWGHDVK